VGCRSKVGGETSRFYDDVINQIGIDLYENCLTPDMNAVKFKLLDEYLDGKIDSNTYTREVNRLKELRKKRSPKCTLTYCSDIGFALREKKLDQETKSEISRNLSDPFVADNFKGDEISKILDVVSTTSKLKAEDFKLEFLDIVTYAAELDYPWGRGMGVVGLSNVVFNKNKTNAVVYYEFICSPKCGAGELLFLTWRSRRWQIDKRKSIWES